MKRLILFMLAVLVFFSWLPAKNDSLVKTPKHIYLATFNVNIFGVDSLSRDPLKKACSDHRPLWMRFKTNADHYDGMW